MRPIQTYTSKIRPETSKTKKLMGTTEMKILPPMLGLRC